ncbi:MAG: hypothetical protein CVV10_10080, partial [Gammaproteobacteria bacterium HGW-Gammaproteobacteria-14]
KNLARFKLMMKRNFVLTNQGALVMKLKKFVSSMFAVIALGAASASHAAILTDIVMIVDESGSMGTVQANLRNNIGTFANIRIRNEMVPGTEGGITRHMPQGEELPIYGAAMRYINDKVPTVIIAGKEYGTGSSRDWAAKGTSLLGIRAVIAESFERIHRSNLIGMGVLPLQFPAGVDRHSLGLDGSEEIDIPDMLGDLIPHGITRVVIRSARGEQTFAALVRLDTATEVEYYKHGGILHYVLRQMM